jgi:hypothetical protein
MFAEEPKPEFLLRFDYQFALSEAVHEQWFEQVEEVFKKEHECLHRFRMYNAQEVRRVNLELRRCEFCGAGIDES